MEEITLKARVRKAGEKLTKDSQEIQAVVYGKELGSVAIFVKLVDLNKVFDKVGESTIIDLQVEDEQGKSKSYKTLIYDYQTASIGNKFTHVDFFNVRMDQKIETKVELEFIGESAAVKEMGGVLVRGLDSVEVQCLPADLPGKIEVDISVLTSFEQHIYVKDLIVSEKVNILTDAAVVVVAVSAPRTKEDVDNLNESIDADISSVEGIKNVDEKNKKEETSGKDKVKK